VGGEDLEAAVPHDFEGEYGCTLLRQAVTAHQHAGQQILSRAVGSALSKPPRDAAAINNICSLAAFLGHR